MTKSDSERDAPYPHCQTIWKELDEGGFYQWIQAYPRPLMVDVCGITEPPMMTWNDFAIASSWPESVVARRKAGSGIYQVLVLDKST